MLTTVMGSNENRTRIEKSAKTISELPNSSDSMSLERGRLEDALAELHNLLEEYAPSWYTEEHHDKAESALRSVKKQ